MAGPGSSSSPVCHPVRGHGPPCLGLKGCHQGRGHGGRHAQAREAHPRCRQLLHLQHRQQVLQPAAARRGEEGRGRNRSEELLAHRRLQLSSAADRMQIHAKLPAGRLSWCLAGGRVSTAAHSARHAQQPCAASAPLPACLDTSCSLASSLGWISSMPHAHRVLDTSLPCLGVGVCTEAGVSRRVHAAWRHLAAELPRPCMHRKFTCMVSMCWNTVGTTACTSGSLPLSSSLAGAHSR